VDVGRVRGRVALRDLPRALAAKAARAAVQPLHRRAGNPRLDLLCLLHDYLRAPRGTRPLVRRRGHRQRAVDVRLPGLLPHVRVGRIAVGQRGRDQRARRPHNRDAAHAAASHAFDRQNLLADLSGARARVHDRVDRRVWCVRAGGRTGRRAEGRAGERACVRAGTQICVLASVCRAVQVGG
jgi:hypothetical protein